MHKSHDYSVHVRWTGAAQGATRNYAGYSREHEIVIAHKPVIRASADPVFRGDAALYNPEEFLVAALSSCHLLSYLALCARNGIAVTEYEDDAHGTMAETGGAGRFERVNLRPRVVVDDDRLELAHELHETAHEQCFIANSVNFPVICEANVVPATQR